MKKLIILTLACMVVWACGNSNEPKPSDLAKQKITQKKEGNKEGVGEIKSVELNDPLNQDMIANGRAIYDLKCAACHKLSDKRVVGPGFKGVTSKRTGPWIMNMITNTDAMLDEDPVARKLFEECLTRMPNQNVSNSDARDILEFLFDNDKA